MISKFIFDILFQIDFSVAVKRSSYCVKSFFLFLFQLNLVFLGMAIVMMCKHASNTVSMKNKEHSRLASTR